MIKPGLKFNSVLLCALPVHLFACLFPPSSYKELQLCLKETGEAAAGIEQLQPSRWKQVSLLTGFCCKHLPQGGNKLVPAQKHQYSNTWEEPCFFSIASTVVEGMTSYK